MLTDIRNAIASLSRAPGFVMAAAFTLALGIGANTAIFSVVNDVLLRDLPYAEPDRLVMIWEERQARSFQNNVISPANFLDWRDRSQSFEGMAGFSDRTYTVTGAGDPEEVPAAAATTNFFSLLGARPLVGRLHGPQDESPEAPLAVVLTHAHWKERYGADPSVIGRSLTLNTFPATIVGVLPEGFNFYVKEASFNRSKAKFWVQSRFDAQSRVRRGRYMAAVGLLKRGVALEAAQAEMSTIAASLATEHPGFNREWGVRLVPVREQVTGEIRPVLLLLFGAVALVLFIACANVANLQLVRATARAREFTMRAALGASRGRLVRLLLVENLLLALAGGALGFVLGGWGLSGLLRVVPADLLPAQTIGLDLRVFSFALAISAVTGLLFGLIPALISSNPRLAEALKDGARGSSGRGRGLRQTFVAAQVALAIVVLIGAGLLVRSFDRLVSSDVGFDSKNLLAARINLPGAMYDEPGKILAFYDAVLGKIRAMPGVTAVTGNTAPPFGGPGPATSFEVQGVKVPEGQEPVTDVRIVISDYFKTLRIPIVQGRDFTPEEFATKRDVVIINETLARKHFPGRNPIGERLIIHMRGPENTPSEIVGVAADVRHKSLDAPAREMTYWPQIELPFGSMTFLVRTEQNPDQLTPALQREVWALDRNIPVNEPRTMEQMMSRTAARACFATVLFSLFASLALVLASLGIYAVVSYKVALETRDIGVRMALGADRARVLRDVLANGATLAAIGVAFGVGTAFAASRVLSAQLYEITPTDPITFIGVPALLLGVAVAACLPAARRAARIEPIAALKED